MENTKFADFENVPGTVLVDTTLEIRIKDFRTSGKRWKEEKYTKHESSTHELKVDITFFVFPNGVYKNTESWVVVVPDVRFACFCLHRPINSSLSWIVSIIDIEGDSRFPQSFEKDGGDELTLGISHNADFSHATYLKRSFILSRADEFIPDGVLTLRCEVYLHLFGVSLWHLPRRFNSIQRSPFKKFFYSLQQRVCFGNDAETGDPRDDLFDLTSEDLTSQKLQDSIESFGLYSEFIKSPSEPKEDITDISEHVWVFEARPDKFILSIDEMKDTVGARLLKASSLIRECVEIPLKGQQVNRIVLQKADSEIFKIVLFFLLVGTLRGIEFYQLLGVYKFSRLYGMKDLQRRCAEYMVEVVKRERNLVNELSYDEELERIAELYSDEYLSDLVESRRAEYENFGSEFPQSRIEESPCFDCYI